MTGWSSGNFDQTLEDCLNTEEVIERVLVFTTLQLLGLLAVCKRGSVDGTFRFSTTLWKQIFIIMCEVRGVFIPIAICWLPNKNTVSYYAALYLLLSEWSMFHVSCHSLKIKIFTVQTIPVNSCQFLAVHSSPIIIFDLCNTIIKRGRVKVLSFNPNVSYHKYLIRYEPKQL